MKTGTTEHNENSLGAGTAGRCRPAQQQHGKNGMHRGTITKTSAAEGPTSRRILQAKMRAADCARKGRPGGERRRNMEPAQ